MENAKIIIPEGARNIVNILRNEGYESYVVGGCVRDSILKKQPDDWDITTNSLPEQTVKIFKNKGYRIIETGLKHGTVTIATNGIGYEVTTYRVEGQYSDNRHPDYVSFTTSLKDDLSRRDFTINALAYNEEKGLIDYFCGIKDLKNKIVKAVGEPNKRFQEDALRMLRAIRFSSKLGFSVEEKTLEAIKVNCNLISSVSNERIREELCKILISNNPIKGLNLLEKTNLLRFILPELQKAVGFNQQNPHHDKDVFEHILSVVDKCPPRINLRLAALLHDIAKPQCFTMDTKGIGHFYRHDIKGAILSEQILRRLKFDNQSVREVSILVKEHMNVLEKPTDASVKRLINRVGKDLIDDLFILQRADALGSASTEIRLKQIDKVAEKVKSILESKVPLSTKELAVNGKDLMKEFSLKPGEEIGNMLKFLLDKVLEDPKLNSKEKLLNIIQDEYAK